MEARGPIYIPQRHIRKLFLPPGLISFIWLPVLALGYAQQGNLFHRLRAFEVVWWSLQEQKLYTEIFNRKPNQSYRDRQYMDIQFNGPAAEDKIRLDFSQLEIRRLANSGNTVKGLRIEFGEKTKYWMLVRALDLCRIENVRTYVSDQDDM